MLSNILKNREFLKFAIYLYLFITSYATCRFLTGIVKRFAQKYGILDHPGERKVHVTPIPVCGGLAILLTMIIIIGFNLSLFFILLRTGYFNTLPEWVTKNYPFFIRAIPELTVLLISMIVVSAVGFIDDLKGLSPRIKFFFQILVAVLTVFSGIRITVFSFPLLNEFLTVVWIVGITNSFNLLDNMDGLSGGVSAIIAFSICAVAVSLGQFFVVLITVTFMGTMLGFLKYNFAPASIFMGDTGSLLIGYLMATIAILTTFYTKGMPNYFPVLIPILFMITPLFDTFSVIFIRLRNKKSIFSGDKNHLSHRLNFLGFSKRSSVVIVYILTIISCFSAILLTCVTQLGAYLIILQLTFLLALTILLMLGKSIKN